MNNINAQKSETEIFDEFISEISQWSKDGTNPAICSLDLNYALELQKKRLSNKNVSINYEYKPRDKDDKFMAETFLKIWNDKKYKNTMTYRFYTSVTDYFVNNKRKRRTKKREVVYAIITWMMGQNTNVTYCCPNCGAIHPIKTLLTQGCPNCRTRFLMSDLFPKVTNYFFVKDQAYGQKEFSSLIRKFLIFGVLAGISAFLISQYAVGAFPTDASDVGKIIEFVVATLMCGGLGIIAGYILWAISKIFSLFLDAFKVIGMLGPNLKAKYSLPKFMQQFDPNFSYEYFVGKLTSMLKIMVFSDDYENLAIYEGPPLENTFKDIIDVQYRGAIGLKGYRVDGDYCFLDMVVYTTDFYVKGNGIRKKNEKFRMTVCKNIKQPPDYGFSIRKVQCKNCGASFDAVRERKCPYCRGQYHLAEDDWVITSFRKL